MASSASKQAICLPARPNNCDDFLIAAPGQQVSTWGNDHIVVGGGRFPLVKLPMDSYDAIRIETVDGRRVKIPRQDRPILYRQGNPPLD